MGYPPRSGYDELDTTLMPPRHGGDQYGRTGGSPATAGSGGGGSGSVGSGMPAHHFQMSGAGGGGSAVAVNSGKFWAPFPMSGAARLELFRCSFIVSI